MKLVFPLYINKSLSTYQNRFVEFFFFFSFEPHHAACGILVPQPGIEPRPPALGARSLNHWTARKFPICRIFNSAYHVFQYPVFQVLKYLSRNDLRARNQGVETLLSTGQSACHSESTTQPPPLREALGQRDGSAFTTSWYLSYRECYRDFLKKITMAP